MNKKEVYGGLLSCITAVAGIDNAKKFDTLFRDHKKLNLKDPQTLSDKVSYIELHEQSPLAASCTDKYAVREYVTNKGLGAKVAVILTALPLHWQKANRLITPATAPARKHTRK